MGNHDGGGGYDGFGLGGYVDRRGRGVGQGDDVVGEGRGDGACVVVVSRCGAAWAGADSGASWITEGLAEGEGSAGTGDGNAAGAGMRLAGTIRCAAAAG